MKIFTSMATSYGLVGAFILVAVIMWVSYTFAGLIKQKRMGSAIAIMIALVVAFIGGKLTGGEKGISDIAIFGGVGLLGGGMMRDYTIVSTAYGVKIDNLKKAGLAGTVALLVGIVFSFVIGVAVA